MSQLPSLKSDPQSGLDVSLKVFSPVSVSSGEGSTISSSNRCDSECSTCLSTSCEATVANVEAKDYVGIFDIFKIGIGPSSSHTMGPMLAGKRFAEELSKRGLLYQVSRVRINLYGSLARTGKGHATDKAVLLGLSGSSPATIDSDQADLSFCKVLCEKELMLNAEHYVHFELDSDLIFNYEIELPHHPNGMAISAYGIEDDHLIQSETYYSIGGGFIKTEVEMVEYLDKKKKVNSVVPVPEATTTKEKHDNICSENHVGNRTSPDEASEFIAVPVSESNGYTVFGQSEITGAQHLQVPYFFSTARELLHLCKVHQLSIAEVMIENECVLQNTTKEEVGTRLDQIAEVMDACVDRGLRVEGRMPVSHIPRRAAQIRRRLQENVEHTAFDPLRVSDWIALYARAVNEENACGGRVVTAPTNGAAGTLPGVLTYYRRSIPTATKQGVRDFLATAAAIGSLCKRNGSISGAEAGCQAEVGSACAMTAAGLCAVLGGTGPQIENAAEIGLEHCLGMTCDPIMGLVQIPCIERNCVASIKAVMACRLALVSDGSHEVSLDSCIETMYRTGLDMQAKYRETATGGLAVFAKKMIDF